MSGPQNPSSRSPPRCPASTREADRFIPTNGGNVHGKDGGARRASDPASTRHHGSCGTSDVGRGGETTRRPSAKSRNSWAACASHYRCVSCSGSRSASLGYRPSPFGRVSPRTADAAGSAAIPDLPGHSVARGILLDLGHPASARLGPHRKPESRQHQAAKRILYLSGPCCAGHRQHTAFRDDDERRKRRRPAMGVAGREAQTPLSPIYGGVWNASQRPRNSE